MLNRHPDHVHVQARDRERQGLGLRPRKHGRHRDLLHRRVALRLFLLPLQVTGESDLSDEVIPDVAVRTVPFADTRVKGPRKRARLKDTWWRHAVGIIGIVVSLFPIVYVISSAFN